MKPDLIKGDWIGWLATIVFMTSYISKSPAMLRRIQALASCLWLTYGVMIHSVPMIVANALVAAVALYSSFSNSSGRARMAVNGTKSS
jgi:riboflavin transporter FmnP